jgi:hypothetical protein
VAVDVETSIEIECPRSMVAAFVSNPDTATQWYVNIQSITWETTPPAVVGSRIAFVAQFLGRRITYTYEVQEILASATPSIATWRSIPSSVWIPGRLRQGVWHIQRPAVGRTSAEPRRG